MSTTPNDGGPAFPRPTGPLPTGVCHDQTGMSLRDWFAGQALAGMLAKPVNRTGMDAVASDAYNYADAMLAERAKPEAAT